MQVLEAIQRARYECRDADGGSGLGPSVERKVTLQREQSAVPPSAHLQSDAALRRWIGGGQFLHAVVDQPHGLPDCFGQGRHGGLEETELSAEATAYRHGIDRDLMVGQAEGPSYFGARVEQRLG